MDFSTKIEIAKLKGKENWATWKYNVSALLEGAEDALEAVNGTLVKPTPVTGEAGAGDAAVSAYKAALAKYKRTESSARLMLTTNMSEETLKKVMRYTTAHEVWKELHRLFDGESQNVIYSLCLEFFGLKHSKEDDIPTHMSKIKNLWNEINVEILKIDPSAKLPEVLLVCKVLDTLDDRYFNFKSSWLMLKQTEKTIDSLTSHLCDFERNLGSQGSTPEEALVTMPKGRQVKHNKDEQLTCNYCSGKGHRVRKCKKWIRDGRPPKTNQNTASGSKSNQVLQMTVMDAFSVNCCSIGQDQDRDVWYVDNGATTHIATRRDFFTEFHEFDSGQTVLTADGTPIHALGQGTVVVESNVNGNKGMITLHEVWLVPSLKKNLFSTLAAQDRVTNSIFISTARECRLEVAGTTKVVGRRVLKGGLYKLEMKTVTPTKQWATEVNATEDSGMLQLYHERLAHQDKKHVIRVVKRELGIQLSLDKAKCEGCIFGKSHRKPFGTRERATAPGELIHADVCGPFTDSVAKNKYFVLFKDDFSSYRMVYFIKQKSEVKDKLLQMLEEAKTAGHVVKTLLTDNGGEFANEAVLGILQCRGIKHRMTMPYTPEQNGCSERENRTLVEAARSIMYARGEMPNVLWAELINTAAYVLNRTGPTRVDDKSPYELWRGKKPKISHLKIIGSECYVHVPKQLRKKMGKKAIKGTLIGYEDDDGYRIWSGAKMLKSRDITFNTNNELRFSTKIPILLEGVESNNDNTSVFEQETEPMPELDNNDEHVLEGDRAESQDQVHPNVDIEDIDRTESQDQVHFETEDTREIFVDADGEMLEVVEPLQEVEPRYNLRDRSGIRPPKKLEDYVCFVGNESFPETFKEAIQRDDSVEWQKAMANEMKSLADNKVWKLCELPPNRKALPCKWVYRIKRNPDGTIDKYKARLVVKGFRQRKGIDYEQTFSPVARMATIRALLSVSAKENLYLTQFDVSTAFLNGKLQEEIYMNQPDGYNDGTSRVCLLQRSLYGLKQAPRCWNSCFEEILLEKGFVQCAADSCLFTKKVGDKKILITLYVDDGLVATTDKDLAEQFLEDLRSSLKITSKPASYYLGLEIARREDGSILIKQESYTKKILERFGMSQCNPVSTPIEKGSTGLTSEEERASERFPYREAVGALAYLMTGTRPDIAYAVGIVSRKLENPTKADWLQVKRIFRYLKGTTSLGIEYKPSLTSSKVIGYSDADHGGCADTGRSTTGVVTYFCGGAISWLSKRQQSVSISTTEAEIVAASEGARELVWLQRIFRQLTDVEEVPILLVDNEAAIRLAHNPEFHKRTKHIRIRHFFVRETVQEGLVDVKKTSSMDQLADIFTKAVPKPCLQRIRDKLGLRLIDVGKC